MVKFIRKCDNRDFKIARINSIRITNLSIYIYFVRCWGSLRSWHIKTNRPVAVH